MAILSGPGCNTDMKLCNALSSTLALPAYMNPAGAFRPWGLVFQ